MEKNTVGAEALTFMGQDYANPNKGLWLGDGSVCAVLSITDSGALEISVEGARDNVYVKPKDMVTALTKLGIVDEAVDLRERVEAVIRPFEMDNNYGTWSLKDCAAVVPKIREILTPVEPIALPKGLGAVIEGTSRDANLPIRLVLSHDCWWGGKHSWSESKIRGLLRDIKVLSEGVL
jgi:hypothetical protein